MTHLLFHFRSLVLSLITAVLLTLFALHTLQAHDRVGLSVIAVLMVITAIVTSMSGHRVLFALLPLSILFTAVIMQYFIDPLWERVFFGIGTSLVYYISLLSIVRLQQQPKDHTAQTLFSISLIATVFFFYSGWYGIYINFDVPLWAFILVVALFIFSTTFASLFSYSTHLLRILLYSSIIAFAMAQIAWMMNFWPFGYLTNAAINLVFYYVFWDLVLMNFLHQLSKKRFLTTVSIAIVLFFLVLLTSRWTLI